jgi:hypothetical protein
MPTTEKRNPELIVDKLDSLPIPDLSLLLKALEDYAPTGSETLRREELMEALTAARSYRSK